MCSFADKSKKRYWLRTQYQVKITSREINKTTYWPNLKSTLVIFITDTLSHENIYTTWLNFFPVIFVGKSDISELCIFFFVCRQVIFCRLEFTFSFRSGKVCFEGTVFVVRDYSGNSEGHYLNCRPLVFETERVPLPANQNSICI